MVNKKSKSIVTLSKKTLEKLSKINSEFDINEKDSNLLIYIVCNILLDLDNIYKKEFQKIKDIIENLFDIIQDESLEYVNSEKYAEALSIYNHIFNSSIFQKFKMIKKFDKSTSKN